MNKSMTATPESVAETNDLLRDSWIRMSTTSVQVTSAWGNEAVRFASRRLARNRETVEQLGKLGSWQEFLDLQMNWARDVLQDYLDESRELIELVQEASNGAVEGRMPEPRQRAANTSERKPTAKHAAA
jgi:hypothetical protein